MSMITATAWVPRGYAANFPLRDNVDDQELSRISKLAKLRLDDAREGLENVQGKQEGQEDDENETASEAEEEGVVLPTSNGDVDDDLKEYDLEHYDSDAVDENGEPMAMFGNTKSLVYHESNADDPYITLHENDDEDEEREELQVLSTDNMIVAAKIEDEVAHLEIYVYEDAADNLYVHHDIMLPAIPLCVEWLDVPVGRAAEDQSSKGNTIAVGTFDPDIEIWDLDTVDAMFPNVILGQGGEASKDADLAKKKKRRKKSKKVNDDYHVDAILSLAANRNHRTLLASASADKTVKLWDLNTANCAKSYSYHTDKVCSIAWHLKETTVLLSGSYDRTVVAADLRAPDAKVPRWGVESDVETVRWDPHDPNFFFVTTENGIIHYHDLRTIPSSPATSKPVWTLQAHDQSVSSFDVNPIIPGFLATGSTDKEVKLWNVQSSGPSMVVSRNLGVGKVFSTTFGPDAEVGFRLAVAGSKGTMQVWDTSTNAAVRSAFAGRVAPVEGEVKERLVGVNDDSTDSEDEPEDVNGEHEMQEDGAEGDDWDSMEDV